MCDSVKYVGASFLQHTMSHIMCFSRELVGRVHYHYQYLHTMPRVPQILQQNIHCLLMSRVIVSTVLIPITENLSKCMPIQHKSSALSTGTLEVSPNFRVKKLRDNRHMFFTNFPTVYTFQQLSVNIFTK